MADLPFLKRLLLGPKMRPAVQANWPRRRALMRAIAAAAKCPFGASSVSRSCGLRVIRAFEAVNQQPFDPFNRHHVHVVANMGRYEFIALLWRVNAAGRLRPVAATP